MAKYPQILSGQRFTEALAVSMLPKLFIKASSTDRTSTITPTIDPDLQFEAEANSVYLIEFMLWPGAILAADFKTEWTVPADALGLKAVFGPGSAANNGAADNINMRCGVHQFATDVIYSGVRDSTGSSVLVREFAVVTTTTGGTIGLNWAQGTSSPTATRLAVGSHLTASRLA